MNREIEYVFFGNGYRARMLADELSRLGIAPLTYVTDEGDCLSPIEAAYKYPNAEYVMALYNDAEPRARLEAMGLRTVSVWEIYKRHGLHNFSEYDMMRGDDVNPKNMGRILDAASIWRDEKSRDLYNALIQWRMDHYDNALPEKDDPKRTYFEFAFSRHEVFVDCGAYHGDTVRRFIREVNDQYDAIYAFEPDAFNLALLEDGDYRIHKICAAVGSQRGAATFVTGKYDKAASRIESYGIGNVNVLPLDMLSCKPTFIKMDIEGSERDALLGAARILREYRPKLAIALYHKPSDLWEIPLLIRSIEPSYQFTLRKYADACWEAVLYACC